ncbi:hypothetical protein SAMN04488109_3747 [Chryseolinea serpens]|uniref:Uncharacterized protein n=2 Tax=Chryseolinea serpens TaxID=947013 RepID=A0A1M5S4T5_9BACT|nr:hypothetical protein SAMN04488109_3747 [Chryseolinea serpens]
MWLIPASPGTTSPETGRPSRRHVPNPSLHSVITLILPFRDFSIPFWEAGENKSAFSGSFQRSGRWHVNWNYPITNQHKQPNSMKPISLIFFFIIIAATVVFAGIYVFSPELVESNPAVFAIGLVSIMVVGMFGMMHFIPSTVVEENRQY